MSKCLHSEAEKERIRDLKTRIAGCEEVLAHPEDFKPQVNVARVIENLEALQKELANFMSQIIN